MTPIPVSDWGQALLASGAAALALLLAAIPRILGFLAILIIGWLIASAIAAIVASVLRSIRFNDLSRRSGFAGFVEQTGATTDSSGMIALIVKWFVRLIALVVAFDALGLPAVSDVLGSFLLWLPNLAVALVVLVVGGLAANALAGLVRGATAEAGLGRPDFLATVTKVAVWAFAIVVAVNQIGIATTLVNALFIATVGAIALALGLAFGLGGRETAAEIVRSWYLQSQQAAPRLGRTAGAVSQPPLREYGTGSTRVPPASDHPSA